jgi:cytochrome bd-type quinol oxidase subunit 2
MFNYNNYVYSRASIQDIPVMLANIVNFMWPLVGILLFGMFIYGGFVWAMSGENAQNKQKAQGILMWAVIGTIVALMSVVIITTFGQVMGVNGSLLNFPF